MFQSVLKMSIKILCSLLAERHPGFHHIKCVHIRSVDIYISFHTSALKVLNE